MLYVQKYLQTKTHDDLTNDLAIKVTRHDTLPLVILNYNQIDSPKTHEIVRECRGLVLHADTHEIVARSFPRFFNWGEVADEMPLFDFSNFGVQSKEDGSLCLIYHFDGEWRANTRGSFAMDTMQFQGFTWREAFLKAFNALSLDHVGQLLNPDITYVCEFVSPWNKIVRTYPEPAMYLLTAYHKDEGELPLDRIEGYARSSGMLLPIVYNFCSIEEIQEFLRKQGADDPTFEGVVIRDTANRRWKIKSATYLGLHRMGSIKENLFNPKNLLPFVLSGEKDELLTYFSEVKEHFEALEQKVEAFYDELDGLWRQSKNIADQKEFALSIVGKTPFAGILFNMRKEGTHDLKKIWQESGDQILKVLKK